MKGSMRSFNTIFDHITTAFFIFDIVCVVLQVFARFVLKASIPFTEELSRYMLVAFGLLGMAVCSRRGEHLGAYFIRDKFKPLQPYIFMFNCLMMLLVSVSMSYGAVNMIILSGNKTASTMPWLPISTLYLFFLISMVLTGIYSIRDFFNLVLIAKGKKEIVSGLSTPTEEV